MAEPASPAARGLRVTIRSDFLMRSPIVTTEDFHWSPGEAVRPMTVEIDGQGRSATTNAAGEARLNIAGLGAGGPANFTLKIKPVDAARLTTDPMGPTMPAAPNPPDRIYHEMSIEITIDAGKLTNARVVSGDGTIGNRLQRAVSADHLPVDLRPLWIPSPNHRGRGADPIETVVLHQTDGSQAIGSTLNTFIAPGVSAHYVVARDGHIVKMVRDSDQAFHAGNSRWLNRRDLNRFSIGIETANVNPRPFSQEQIDAIIALVRRYSVGRNVVGHSDILVGQRTTPRLGLDGQPLRGADGKIIFLHDNDLLNDERQGCPGTQFRWDLIDAAGLGMVPNPGAATPTMFGGYFSATPANPFLRRGDNDRTQIYGGGKNTAFTGLITEIQNDLVAIGYSIRAVNGVFDEHTFKAVDRLQRHFLVGSRAHTPTGSIDDVTATMIKEARP